MTDTFDRTDRAAALPSDLLLSGARLLHQAFLREPYRSIRSQSVVFGPDDTDPHVILIHRGIGLRRCTLPDGRRSLLDVLLPGDIVGLDHAVIGSSEQELVAATALGFQAISGFRMRALMEDQAIAVRALALAGQTRRRMDRHLAAVCCLSTRERLCVFLLDVYDRMLRRGLVDGARFVLPMMQKQIAHYLGVTPVHVSRTFLAMRAEGLVEINRQVVVLLNVDGLREIVSGLPPTTVLPEVLRRDAGGDMALGSS